MINIEKLTQAGIDYDAGLTRFMEDKNLYEAVLGAFIREDVIVKSDKTYYAKDMDALFDIIHDTKGASGNAGFEELYQKASVLVSMLRSKDYTEEELKKCYDKFVAAYRKTWNGVEAALAD